MARMIWGAPGSRYFETGVDRGVLYPLGGPGVPWPGLVSVQERPTGGGPRPYYYDGVKYANLAEASEFEAEVEVISTPPEFDACVGVSQISNGLFVTEQRKTPFGFSYRTGIGTDLDNDIKHYKIHLVYGALAEVGGRSYQSISNEPNVQTQTWSMTTTPQRPTGFRPSAHFISDSRYREPSRLRDLEFILYGNAALTPRLPAISELRSILGRPELESRWVGTVNQSSSILSNPRTGELLATNLATNPSFEATSGTVEVARTHALNPDAILGGGASAWDQNVYSGTGGVVSAATQVSDAAWSPSGKALRRVWTAASTGAATVQVVSLNSPARALTAGTWTVVQYVRLMPGMVPIAPSLSEPGAGNSITASGREDVGAGAYRLWATISLATFGAAWTGNPRLDSSIAGARAMDDWIESGPVDIYPGAYQPAKAPFSGSRSPDSDLAPAWTGAANASASVLRGAGVAAAPYTAQCVQVSSTQWASRGMRSLRVIPTSTSSTDSTVLVAGGASTLSGSGITFEPGKTYTVLAKCRIDAPQVGTLGNYARRIRVGTNTAAGWTGAQGTASVQPPNVAGEHEQRVTFTVPSGAVWCAVWLYNGATAGGGDVWWDDLAIIEGNYTGPWFDGSNLPATY